MKRITTAADLAINGAPPAFSHYLHVGSPNVGSRATFLRYAEEIFDRNWFSNNGPVVQEFEARVAKHLDARHCIAMCNGTVALEIAIRALKLEGEVILPSYTFIATAHALHWQAITPVFADIDPETHNLSPDAVRRMITPRTTGIIGVHLWGRAAPVEALQEVADAHGLALMFDAAHAFGCSHRGRMIGNFGCCEVFSFHATKYFNTFEGGAVVTNNDELAEEMRLMRNFGFAGLDKVIHPGTNGKMIEMSAAMGLVNLDFLDKVIETNKRNHKAYCAAVEGLPGIRILPYDEDERNNFQYVVMQVDKACPASRDRIIAALHAENVRARRYFWPGCHRMKPYRDLFPHSGLLLPNTIEVADRIVVLPTGTAIGRREIEVIVSIVRTVIEASR